MTGGIELRHNPAFDRWEQRWSVRFVTVDGEDEVGDFIQKLEAEDISEHRAFLGTLKLVLSKDRVVNPHRVSRGDDHRDIYEMKNPPRHFRVFFFYHHGSAMMICTNALWKTDGGKKQDAAFARADAIRKRVLTEVFHEG